MQRTIFALPILILAAGTLTSTHTLAQPQTPAPQLTVVVPPGTSAEIVSVESRVVAPGEIQIGAPIVERAVERAPEGVVVVPSQPEVSAESSQDIHLEINLRLRVETPTPPVIYAAPPPAPAAPSALPVPAYVPERAPSHLQLHAEAPRRRYGLPIGFLVAGAATTFIGGSFAAFDEDLMFLPAIGAGLLVTGVVTLILRVSRFRRARRDYQQQGQFTF